MRYQINIGFGGREKSLGLSSLINCSKSVNTIGSKLGCPVFNKKIPSEKWLRDYIDDSVNIMLTEESIGLDESIQGAVFKKQNDNKSLPCKNLYLVYLSSEIIGNVKRVFVLTHEIGHILLHGRIINPGMMLNLTSQNWDAESTLCKQMEAEANIFSLISVIPDIVIEKVISSLPDGRKESELVSYLGAVLSELYQEPFPYSLVRDRLLVRRMIRSSSRISVDDALASMRIRSWIGSDTNYFLDDTGINSTSQMDEYLVAKLGKEIRSMGLLMH